MPFHWQVSCFYVTKQNNPYSILLPFSGKQKHRTSLRQTSVLLPKEVRCFATSGHHCSASSRPLSLSLHKKSFWKISYISYTTPPIILYLLTISGEGWGVGCVQRCRTILHLSPVRSVFLPMFSFRKRSIRRGFVQDDEEKCKNDARIGRKTCIILHQSYILHLILHPILHPKSLVNTTGFSGGCRKCRRFSKNFFFVERAYYNRREMN